ncbi:MAG TPA: hypothetical protein ENN24_01975 [Bacteroidetes bacterium]|nr:hypothetical protein [Bacteroidota bacterium]
MFRRLSLLYTLIILLAVRATGQHIAGEIAFADAEKNHKCFVRINAKDTLLIHSAFYKCLSQIRCNGFLEARIDSLSVTSKRALASGYLGDEYSFSVVKTDSLTLAILKEIGLQPDVRGRFSVNPDFLSISKQAVQFLENSGYPFALINFSDVTIGNGQIEATSSIVPGPKIAFDTLFIKGDAKVKRSFLEAQLRFRKGNEYQECFVEAIDKQINQLGFISTIKPTEVEFTPGKARLYTYIANKAASSFSGIVGFASGESSSGLQLTGDVNINLLNVFKRGELNRLRWQAMGEGSQRLNMSTSWPFVYGSNVSVRGAFSLFRRDTSYLTINPSFAFHFRLPSNYQLGLGVNYKQSVTTNPNASYIAEYRTLLYTVSLTSKNTSNELLPVSLFSYSATVGVGTRKAEGNQLAEEMKNRTMGEVGLAVKSFFPVYKKSLVVHNKLVVEAMTFTRGDNDFVENEAYLTGGANSIRGFNDESIIARYYAYLTTELQLRLQSNLNVYVFNDSGFASFSSLGVWSDTFPWSVGVGAQIVSKGGVFNISYALGKGLGQELNMKNAKVHLGYLARF